MLYNVTQISESTGQSKQNIYKKLQKKELKVHIIKKQGITYINEIGLKLINDSYETNPDDEVTTEDATVSTLNENMFNLLKEQLKEKDLQISEKDKQISNFDERMRAEQDLHKNTQILFKQQQQPPDIKQLEEHFQDLDTKLEEVKGNMLERKEQQQKGFFSKIFKK